jgi:sulfate/thiosulfate transport system permease protein
VSAVLSNAVAIKPRRVLPGFGLTLGFSLVYLCLIVLIPLAALVAKATTTGWTDFWRLALDRRTLAALRVSIDSALIAALIDSVAGTVVAWSLVRYRFPGRLFADAAVDLPFALPTSVAGIALTSLCGPNGWIGGLLAPLGVRLAYTPTGVVIALIFVGLPFVVRTLQPILEDLPRDLEEAAATLGAGRFSTILRVLLPAMTPALLTGFALAFARGLGEYGSVIFIAGNIPGVSEIAPLLIVIRLQEFDYAGATAIACEMLAISFAALLTIHLLQTFSRRRFGHV